MSRTTFNGAVISLLLVTLCACGGADPAQEMIGTWKVDMEAMKNTEEFKKASEMEQGMMAAVMETSRFTVTADKISMTMSMMGQSQTTDQQYKVTKTEGKTLTVELTDPEGKTKSGKCTVDGDRLTLIDGDGKPVPLVRVKE